MRNLSGTILLGCVLVVGCGGTSTSGGQGLPGAVAGAPGSGGGSSGTPPACVVANRLDDCCMSPVLATSDEVAANACLTLYPSSNPSPEELAACPQPDICAVVDCALVEPPSRVAAFGENGSCDYVDECATDVDCVVATDHHACCRCPEAFPASLLQIDPCVSVTYVGIEAGCADCSLVDCGPCELVELSPSCQSDGSYRTCR